MSTQDKKIKVVNDIDLKNNEIENAKIDYNKNQITNLPNTGSSNKTFDELGIVKITNQYTFVELAQEIQALQLPIGTIIFGEVTNTGLPDDVSNAEVKVEILDTKTSGSPHYQVMLFTLCSSDVSPYQWIFVYYQPNYDNHHQTWDWVPISGGGSSTEIDQADYWQRAEVLQDSIIGITGNITIDENVYFTQVTLDRCINYFKYDGSDWYLGDPDKGETPTLVDLTDYGIDVSQATFGNGSSFEIYSEYLNGKTSFTVSQLVTIHSVFLNGNLQLKKDYVINNHTITFNDYTLKASDSISII